MTQIDRSDIQGNILDGYSFAYTKHMLVRFRPRHGRGVLDRLIPQLTTAEPWSVESKPPSTLNIGISYAGLVALGLPDGVLSSCPQAFREGMRARAAALGDDPDRFDSEWEEPVHLWLWIYAADPAQLSVRQRSIRAALGNSAASLFEIDGYRMQDAAGRQIEHFGFRDGISQPAVVGSLMAPRAGDGVEREDGSWRSLATGEFLLGHEDESGEVVQLGTPALNLSLNGTFAVFRRLEQDVAAFRAYIRTEARKLNPDDDNEVTSEWLAERMVGRRKDGTALHQSGTVADEHLNAFTFRGDDEGRVCPLGSHLRRTNPRGNEAFRDAFARHRVIRRSQAYGRPYDDTGEAESGENESRGLLFVAINADVERQFEFLQRRYINDGAASRQGGDVDPLVGVPARRNFVIPGDPSSRRDTLICSRLPELVYCRGGEYFMLPGKRALEAIRDAAVDAPAVSASITRPEALAAAASVAEPLAISARGEEAAS